MAEVVEFEWYPEPLVVAGQIDDIANALENLNIPLTLSLPEVSAAIQRQFDSEGEGSWPYWSEKYAPFAEANNEGILIQSGALVEGATSEYKYTTLSNPLKLIQHCQTLSSSN